jgi:hypothetical protein
LNNTLTGVKVKPSVADEMASFSGGESPKRLMSPDRANIMSDTEPQSYKKKFETATPRVLPNKGLNFNRSTIGSFISPRSPAGVDLSAMSMGSGGLSSQMNLEHLD